MLMSQWQPNPPPQDLRDYIFGAPTLRPDVVDHDWDVEGQPGGVDLRPHAGSIEDQRGTNACTGKTTISACEIIADQANRPIDLSALFVYYNARAKSGEPVTDSGSSIRQALAQATKHGVAALTMWPYDASKVNTKPDQVAYTDGQIRKITRYETLGVLGKNAFGGNVQDENRIIVDAMVAVASGYPVLFSMGLHKGFLNLSGSMHTHPVMREKMIPSHPEWLGYHAMLVVGYDAARRYFIIENSWGTGWGDMGYTRLPFDVFGRQVMGNECFVVREFWGTSRSLVAPKISRSMQSPLKDNEIRDHVVPIVNNGQMDYYEQARAINAYARQNRISRPRMAQAVGESLAVVNKYLDFLW